MKHLSKNGKVLLEKLDTLAPPTIERSEYDVPVVVLDVETTGLNYDTDQVIQIGLRPFLMNEKTHDISLLKKGVSYFQEASNPLPDIIREITGLRDEDLKGKSIPWNRIASILSACKYIICHNAEFDKKWIEKELASRGLSRPQDSVWCCSMSQVDWTPVIRSSKALEVLCAWHGFFYDAHDALADVDATLHLLRTSNNLGTLIINSVKPEYQVFAVNSLREENHLLKSRRYRWNPELSSWWKGFMNKDKAEVEMAWLASNLKKVEPQIFEIAAQHRFS